MLQASAGARTCLVPQSARSSRLAGRSSLDQKFSRTKHIRSAQFWVLFLGGTRVARTLKAPLRPELLRVGSPLGGGGGRILGAVARGPPKHVLCTAQIFEREPAEGLGPPPHPV